MKIIITEDNERKRADLRSFAMSCGVRSHQIILAKDLAEFASKFDESISICVIDLRLPAYTGGDSDKNGIGVLQAIDQKGLGKVKMLAISGYPDEFAEVRGQFESRGCILLDYNDAPTWQAVFKQMILQCQAVEVMDFIIVCALRSERQPYLAMPDLNPTPVFKDGFTRLDIEIGGKRGTILELPRMGLVDAAAVAGAAIEKFKPALVAMSGVCAGFSGRAAMGQILVSEMAYEYQSGKWTDDQFLAEPYQVPTSQLLVGIAREILDEESLLRSLEEGWNGVRPSEMTPPKLCSFTSGSAVIASSEMMEHVSSYHRRVSGLDMEVYAILRSAHLSKYKPEAICVKTVVDLADAEKDKRLQPYGAFVSSRLLVRLVKSFFDRKSEV